jgi:hypothetical protein
MAGLDYVAASGTVVFPPGSTNQKLIVKVIGDLLNESSETFEVDLFSPTNAAIIDNVGVGRILNDDPFPILRISDVTVTEPSPGQIVSAVFDISLSAPSGLPVSVNFVTSNGTAVAEQDYSPQSGRVTFPLGATNVQISIPVFGDKAAESAENFFINLSAPINASLEDAQGQGTILDNGFTELDHFTVTGWPSPQYAGTPFVASVMAKDARNNPFHGFAGRVSIRGLLPQPEVLVGAGTSTWANPLGTLYHDARTQVIYLADELGGAGNLSGLSLFVTTPPGQTLSNWTIRLKHTALTKYLKPVWESAGWTVVYQNSENISAIGWVTFLFAAPFAYDGTNNLMVDFSFNNSSFSTDGQVRYSSTTDHRTLHFRTDSAFGDPLTWSGAVSPPPSVSNAAPNLRLLREFPAGVTPDFSGNFIDGLWIGAVTINQPGANVLLRVSDGAAHFGSSDPFIVESASDRDGDGLPDSWQARYFPPGAANRGPNDDPDHDGLTNLEEFRAGTDPLDAISAIRFTNVRSINGDVWIEFQTVLGKAYRLERSDNLAGGTWVSLAEFIVGTGSPVQIIDSGAASQRGRFYRVRLLP